MTLVDDILTSYEQEPATDGSVPAAPNQIQRSLERQITALQTQPGNTTIEKDNVAIRAVKVPLKFVFDERLIFETVDTGDGSKLGQNSSTITTGEAPREETEVAISFQLPQDILDKVNGNNSIYVLPLTPLLG